MVLIHLKKYYKNVNIIAFVCFLMYFFFPWKVTLRPQIELLHNWKWYFPVFTSQKHFAGIQRNWRPQELINKSELINLVIQENIVIYDKEQHCFLFIDNSQANLTGSNNEVLLSQIDNSNSQKQLFADVLQNRYS